MITPLVAAKAYAAAGQAPSLGKVAGSAAGGQDFGDMLKGVLNDTVHASRAAETSLETVMAVRDQVIAAYQEIMRMPI